MSLDLDFRDFTTPLPYGTQMRPTSISVTFRQKLTIVTVIAGLTIFFFLSRNLYLGYSSISTPKPKMGVTHIVFFQFKASASTTAINDVRAPFVFWHESDDSPRFLNACSDWRTIVFIPHQRSHISSPHPEVPITRPKDYRYGQFSPSKLDVFRDHQLHQLTATA